MSATLPAGGLVLRLHTRRGRVAGVKIVSTRPPAALLLKGKTPDQAVPMVPLLFSLCGAAQGVAAQAALQAAQGRPPGAAQLASWAGMVRREASIEHLWHLMLDWPHILGLSRPEQEYADFRRQCLQARTDDGHAALLETIMAAGLIGIPAADWLNLDQPAWSAWRESSTSLAAQLLRHLNDRKSCAGPGVTCLPRTVAADWVGREQEICTPAYCSTPTWLGEPRETGALARQYGHALVSPLLGAGRSIEARLTARLVELACWACGEVGAVQDWVDVARCGQNTGLTRVETGRGVLIHRVRVEDGVIEEYAIVAPTEWNFHPRGAFVREVACITAAGDADLLRMARLVALSLDPCVAYETDLESS